MTNRYSLADYTLQITVPAIGTTFAGGPLILGGPGNVNEGSFLGDVTISRKSDTWSTSGDYTGSWVHSKNLDRTGTITVDLNQVSDDAIRLYMLTAIYETASATTEGITIEILKGADKVVSALDCYVQKPADLPISGAAQNLRWVFTCGKIDFTATTNWDLVTATAE